MFKQKRNYFAAILTAVFITLTFGVSPFQAAPAASQVGYVDFIYLVDHHPDTVKANKALKAEQKAAKKEFAEKSAGLGDKEKQELDLQLSQQVEQKRLPLLKPISDNVVAAANEVAKEKSCRL